MAFLDFLKKKELEEIKQLKNQLERYKSISDIEKAVTNKEIELNEIITNKEIELNSIITQKTTEINNKEKEYAALIIKRKADFDSVIVEKIKETKALEENVETLKADYKSSLEIYTRLRKEVGIFESKLDIIEYGIYEPVYDFAKSDDYRTEQNQIIESQKEMIRLDIAAICNTKWTVGDSEAKGAAVVNRYKKLMLRAFNGEADVMITKVKWNNIDQMKMRLISVFNAINKLGEGFNVYLNIKYRELKRDELILEYEYQMKKQKEKEEIRAIQEELREEEKARREYEQAQKEAAKDEANYEKALEKARKEVDIATGEKQRKLQAQIEKLEAQLKEAQEKKERALSMAQQTKRGYIYIISNIGSFGENVYKIGMTRRLEPTDRIHELGSASVPFHFDIHAMVYSDEARTLENDLHKAFAHRKKNMMNYRKEFFNVTLEEIEEKIKEIGLNAEFTRLPEAMEYRETLAILEKMNAKVEVKTVEELVAEEFPSSLN